MFYCGADVCAGSLGGAGGGLERNQSNCVLTNFVEGRRSLLIAST
jgi:hypothetical protein